MLRAFLLPIVLIAGTAHAAPPDALDLMKKSDERDWLVQHYVPGMLDSVFIKSAGWAKDLRGKVKATSGSKVRIEYDWSSGAQAQDWIFVDQVKSGFVLPEQYYGKLRKDERPHQVKVDPKDYQLATIALSPQYLDGSFDVTTGEFECL